MAKPGAQREEFAYERGRRDERQRVLAELELGETIERLAAHRVENYGCDELRRRWAELPGNVQEMWRQSSRHLLAQARSTLIRASVLGSEEGVMPNMRGDEPNPQETHNPTPSPSGDGRELREWTLTGHLDPHRQCLWSTVDGTMIDDGCTVRVRELPPSPVGEAGGPGSEDLKARMVEAVTAYAASGDPDYTWDAVWAEVYAVFEPKGEPGSEVDGER